MAREITRSRSSTPPTPPPLNPNVLPQSVVPEVSMVEAEDVTGVTLTPEYVSLFLSPPLCCHFPFFPLSLVGLMSDHAVGRMLTSSQAMDAETTLGIGGSEEGGR